MKTEKKLKECNIHLFNDDAINLYDKWDSPTVIISDGPYGIKGFKGDLKTTKGLAEWYEPHIAEWTKKSTAKTTLWFWCTEQGWATVHPILLKYGWDFKACNVWDKGMSHVAGNVNTKTISHLPVVSEICVQYVKRAIFKVGDEQLNMMDWLISEWKRTGLPMRKTNEACGVIDAATRKYFTKDEHLWYMPPTDKFVKIVEYANNYGREQNRPYFSINGKNPLTAEDWDAMRPIFNCPIGLTNIWRAPQLRDKERLKNNNKSIHLNQKPLSFISQIIEMSSMRGDVVWDAFGGLFTTAVACLSHDRVCFSSEINPEIYAIGCDRLKKTIKELFK